ncbi:MAG TPA: helix-turn-helix transcriptional regulator [Anaerolineae bacterium]|nr:helix-turn-helix transcriptional regulator [Anaerolineae bacterium]
MPNKLLSITERQRQVLVLLAKGATDYEIANQLDISARTVQFHVDRIKERLEARSRPELITRAHEQGLLP